MASTAHAVNFGDDDVHKLEPLVSRSVAREKIRAALRLYCGRGRRHSVKELSEGAGVPERAIEAAMCFIEDENYRPLALENLLSIAKFLKAPFVSIYLELAGLGAFELMDGQPPLPGVLASADAQEDVAEERRRLILRLAELEGVQ
jgi:hypothetical protein